jgi:hypothetical protein
VEGAGAVAEISAYPKAEQAGLLSSPLTRSSFPQKRESSVFVLPLVRS